jgi:S-adenosylmethionine decarboxylase
MMARRSPHARRPDPIIRAMQGLHLTAELEGCDPAQPLMRDAAALRDACLGAVRRARLTVLGDLFHRFEGPGGVTGMVLLAESHLALHTWPELAAVTLDVFVCNRGADRSAAAQAVLDGLTQAFSPCRVRAQRLQRALPHPPG